MRQLAATNLKGGCCSTTAIPGVAVYKSQRGYALRRCNLHEKGTTSSTVQGSMSHTHAPVKRLAPIPRITSAFSSHKIVGMGPAPQRNQFQIHVRRRRVCIVVTHEPLNSLRDK